MSHPGPWNSPWQIGSHVLEADGADMLVVRLQGKITAADATQIVALDRAQAQRNGYSLILIDGRLLTGFGADARQATFAEMKRHSGYIGSTAIYGLSGTMAWIMKLVLRGVAVLASYIDDEVQLFDTEHEGREFLVKRRLLRQRQAAQRRCA